MSAILESQITLVNAEPITELVFTKSSVLNTVLLLNGKPYFKIATVDAAAARTTITEVQTNELLVTIKRHNFHSDTIKFAYRFEGKSIKIKDWLCEEKMNNGYTKWNIETPVGDFSWRSDVKLRFALCPANDLDHPVAWVQLPTEIKQHALVLKRGTESFRDQIVAAFVILEQKIRMKEKEYFKADGIVADERTLAGMHVSTGSFNRR